ncbi:hypothetical protein Hypma_012884 [Hypsizygus marmoreus]|uniref:Hemerythrin-like domain-containing protein n=1 Tax=Hypsizygus marmoreus TaxID=39966 RepID=A0A369JHX7_HYPMA|nr:hypothetical protein Hypma_012884 [Hypsizygus marmoreus]
MSIIESLRTSLETFKRSSLGPQPKDIYAAQHWEMAGAHAMLVNALLNVYEKSSSVPQDKVQAFIEYALQWYAALDHHHRWEENIYYPLYSPKFSTETIVAEHETFHSGVEKLREYLTSCLPAGTVWGYSQTVGPQEQQKFDDVHFRTLIDDFADALVTHLVQEIGYLEPEKIRASGLTEGEVKHIADVSEKHMKSMPPFTFLIYTIIHTPKESGFPPVPGFVRNFLAPYIFYLPNRRLWQFAPEL